MAGTTTRFLAGGTDLVLQMKEAKVRPDALIDLGRIPQLKLVQVAEDWLEIGSMVTFASLRNNSLIRDNARSLWLASETMGSPQIRNQATIGGNLGNNSPAADGLPPLLALGAQVRIATGAGERNRPLSEVVAQGLRADELIVGFRIPLQNWQSGFAKLGRRQALAIARLSVAIAIKSEGKFVKDVNIAFGAVGRNAFLCESLASSLVNQELTPAWIEQAAAGAQQLVDKSLGARPSAPYKKVAVGGVMRKAIESLGL